MPIFASIFCPPAALAPTSGLSLALCFSSSQQPIDTDGEREREREGRKWRVLKLSDHFAQLPISHHPLSRSLTGSEKSRGARKGRERAKNKKKKKLQHERSRLSLSRSGPKPIAEKVGVSLSTAHRIVEFLFLPLRSYLSDIKAVSGSPF